MNEFPWPKLGLKPFQYGSETATAANLKWFGMGDTEGYAAGFKKGIERIISTLRSGDVYGHPDQLFYPVAYLARHFFELMMKHLIVQSSDLMPPQIIATELSNNHSLDSLWKKLRPKLEELWPNGPSDDLDAVENVLLEFHRLDPNSTTFRYDTDRKGNKHSANLPEIVDLENLWQTVRDVGAFFEGCSSGIHDMVEGREV